MIIYSQKPLHERVDCDFYPTPYPLAVAALDALPADFQPKLILDPGCGDGVWGRAARAKWPNAIIVGVDIRHVQHDSAYTYTFLLSGKNFMFPETLAGFGKFDLIMGNPPYGDEWDQEQRELAKEAKARGETYKRPPRPADKPLADAERFCRKCLTQHLSPNGIMMFLLRSAFLESGRRIEFWSEFPDDIMYYLPERPSFIEEGEKAGKTDATAYSIFVWRNGVVARRMHDKLLWKPKPERKPRKKADRASTSTAAA